MGKQFDEALMEAANELAKAGETEAAYEVLKGAIQIRQGAKNNVPHDPPPPGS